MIYSRLSLAYFLVLHRNFEYDSRKEKQKLRVRNGISL